MRNFISLCASALTGQSVGDSVIVSARIGNEEAEDMEYKILNMKKENGIIAIGQSPPNPYYIYNLKKMILLLISAICLA